MAIDQLADLLSILLDSKNKIIRLILLIKKNVKNICSKNLFE